MKNDRKEEMREIRGKRGRKKEGISEWRIERKQKERNNKRNRKEGKLKSCIRLTRTKMKTSSSLWCRTLYHVLSKYAFHSL
jgi:hypothetical protein